MHSAYGMIVKSGLTQCPVGSVWLEWVVVDVGVSVEAVEDGVGLGESSEGGVVVSGVVVDESGTGIIGLSGVGPVDGEGVAASASSCPVWCVALLAGGARGVAGDVAGTEMIRRGDPQGPVDTGPDSHSGVGEMDGDVLGPARGDVFFVGVAEVVGGVTIKDPFHPVPLGVVQGVQISPGTGDGL